MFQLIISRGGSCRPSEGSPRPHANFFAIFNLKLICHLSSQEAFFVWSLTQDPSLTWNTVITFSFRIHLLKVLARFFILLVTFKILHGVAPSYLKDLVSFKRSVKTYLFKKAFS